MRRDSRSSSIMDERVWEKTLIGQGIIRVCNGSHILHLLISQNLYYPEIAMVKYVSTGLKDHEHLTIKIQI